MEKAIKSEEKHVWPEPQPPLAAACLTHAALSTPGCSFSADKRGPALISDYWMHSEAWQPKKETWRTTYAPSRYLISGAIELWMRRAIWLEPRSPQWGGEETLGPRTMSLPIRQCARRERYQIIPASAESLKSVFYSFLSRGWGDTARLINLCEGQRGKMKWCPLFSHFTKTCLKLQCGICAPRQMHIKKMELNNE